MGAFIPCWRWLGMAAGVCGGDGGHAGEQRSQALVASANLYSMTSTRHVILSVTRRQNKSTANPRMDGHYRYRIPVCVLCWSAASANHAQFGGVRVRVRARARGTVASLPTLSTPLLLSRITMSPVLIYNKLATCVRRAMRQLCGCRGSAPCDPLLEPTEDCDQIRPCGTH